MDVQQLYSRGLSVKRIVRETGLPVSRIYSLLDKSQLRYPHVPDAVREAIAANETAPVRRLAAELQISKTTVHRIRQQFYRDEDAAGDAGDEVGFVELERPWRCPEHGLVHYWPCVSCAAKRQ